MKKSTIVLLGFLAVGLGLLIAFFPDLSAYKTFATALENEGKEYHIPGEFVKGTLDYQPNVDANVFSFTMKDEDGKACQVICNDEFPQEFELAEKVVVIGSMQQDKFYANKLLTKCPSKYTDEGVSIKDGQSAALN